MIDIKQLINICENYIYPSNENVVIKEPYIPYIPADWSGVLVLAESQNLSVNNLDYINFLNKLTVTERIQRLEKSGESVGVYPWDDGSLKLAVQASLKIEPSRVGVSNAVLWSQRGDNSENINPDLNLQLRSTELWKELLPMLKPKKIICCGKIAKNVIDATKWSGDILHLRLPAKTAMSRVSGMFKEEDLLNRYPEVADIVNSNPSWLEGSYRQNKIFFACHAVSNFSNCN